MRRLLFIVIICPVIGLAQVGIGTSSPSASAKLQVDASNQGFLPPRIALQGTDDAALPTPRIASPAIGLLVYNTATAGSGSTSVTPGLYYYDGVRWQRVINTQDATVTFNGTTPATATTFTGGPAASGNYIYVSDTDNSQWTWNGTAYVTYTPPASTAWFAAGGIVDAGSNKSSSIVRSGKVGIGGNTAPNATLDIRTSPTSASDPGAGFIGIGTTNATAANAAAGALRYNTTSGGVLEYSNGMDWYTLGSNVQKANVYATRLGSPFTIDANKNTNHSFGSFTSSSGPGTSRLDNSTGVYTAPRTGLYTVSAGISFVMKNNVRAEGVFFFLVMKGGISGTEICNQAVYTNGPFNQPISANISCAIPLNAGETVQLKYLNWSNSSVEISLDGSFQGRYYFSVTEN